jgi:hypothetical protein
MNYKLTCTNQITGEVDPIDFYETVEQANIDLTDIWNTFNNCSIVKPSPIITNSKGLSFCYSTTGKHEIYQVEVFDVIMEQLFDILKPINQN